jgi:uncharacterized protein YraI
LAQLLHQKLAPAELLHASGLALAQQLVPQSCNLRAGSGTQQPLSVTLLLHQSWLKHSCCMHQSWLWHSSRCLRAATLELALAHNSLCQWHSCCIRAGFGTAAASEAGSGTAVDSELAPAQLLHASGLALAQQLVPQSCNLRAGSGTQQPLSVTQLLHQSWLWHSCCIRAGSSRAAACIRVGSGTAAGAPELQP